MSSQTSGMPNPITAVASTNSTEIPIFLASRKVMR